MEKKDVIADWNPVKRFCIPLISKIPALLWPVTKAKALITLGEYDRAKCLLACYSGNKRARSFLSYLKKNEEEEEKERKSKEKNRRRFFYTYFFHNDEDIVSNLNAGISEAEFVCDNKFIERLIKAYIVSADEFFRFCGMEVEGTTDWEKKFFGEAKADIHKIVYEEHNIQKVKELLSDPHNSDLWLGFHAPSQRCRVTQEGAYAIGRWDFDILYRFTEAVGVQRCWNPENCIPEIAPDPDTLVRELEGHFGVELEFPTPYPHMSGVRTYRGLAGHRGIWGLYVAALLGRFGARRVLEIGAGLGWIAYHAAKFGVEEYYIVDIPLTALASSHFLGLVCGEDSVHLYGEDSQKTESSHGTQYTIVPPNAFPKDQRFDVVVNVDSMTEMPKETAEAYISVIKQVTNRFISINHEANPFTVAELLAKDPDVKHYIRNAFWLRRGYVEEIFEF